MEAVILGDDIGHAVIKAAGVLRRGGVILYPTDTVYGLGVDAFSDEGVAVVERIKGRDGKPISCVVADLSMAAQYAEINDAARKLAEKFLPGALTLILKKLSHLNSGIARGHDTIGIRVPNDEFCIELARSFGKPFTTTSANVAGEETKGTPDEILEQIGERGAAIDLVINGGRLSERKSSTVVNLVSGFPSILREGAIPSTQIMER